MELRGTRLSSWSAELTLRTTSVEMPSVSPTREAHLRGKCLRYTRGSWIWHHANLDPRTSAPFCPAAVGAGSNETSVDCSESFSSRCFYGERNSLL